MPHVVWKLSDARCVLSVAFSMLHVACCRLHFPRCMLHVVCCLLHVFQWSPRHADRWIVSACPFFVACRTFSVACGRISVACCPPHCPISHAVCAVCRLSHLASRHVARCMTHALCRFLSLVRCLSHLARCLLHAVCCLLQSDSEPSCSQRIAAALAI